MHHRILLLTFPAFMCAAALSGCGGGGSDASDGVEAAAAQSPLSVATAPGQTKKSATSPNPDSGTISPAPAPAPAPAPDTVTVAPDTGTISPAPAPSAPVFTDGTARLNTMLAGSLNVAIPSGVYMITGPLNVRNGQVIAPAVGAQVTFKAASGYTGRMITAVDQSFTVRGVTFDGSYADRRGLEGADSANLLNISGGSVVLENNRFQYAPAAAIWTYRSASIQIRGNTFLETYHPIRMDANNLQAGVIENNTFTNTTAYKSLQHITAVNTVNLVVRGNTMSGAGVAVPASHGYEGTWGNSIYIFNSTGYLVENNTVGKNYWSSIVVGQNSTNVTVRNNSFSHGTLGGNTGGLQSSWIEQVGANSIIFTGNTLIGGLSAGDTGGDHLTITNNNITVPAGGTGIDCNFAFKHGTISGNIIKAATTTKPDMGIYLWQKDDPSTSILLSNNTISGFNKGVAINNMGGSGTVYGITLSGNAFSNNNTNVWVPSTIRLNQPLGQ